MLNLDAIDQATLLARGKLSTVKGAHEAAKQQMTDECGHAMALLVALQRDAQKTEVDVDSHLDGLERALKRLREKCAYIAQLAAQRKALKSQAWPT